MYVKPPTMLMINLVRHQSVDGPRLSIVLRQMHQYFYVRASAPQEQTQQKN